MRVWNFSASALAVAGLIFVAGGGQARAACQLQELAKLPVIMVGNRPMIEASINGQPVHLLIDTGAFKTLLTRDGAEKLGLHMSQMDGVRLYGVGGASGANIAHIKDLQLGDMGVHDVDIMVIDKPFKDDLVGVLGQDVLLSADLEIDLAAKVVRLIKPKDCHDDQVVYWANTYSYADLKRSADEIVVNATLNGQQTWALLDTGASRSVVTLEGAREAGVTPHADGVKDEGSIDAPGGVIHLWTGTFKTLGIGSETVQNAQLQVSDMFSHNKQTFTGSRLPTDVVDEPDMLLGVDFIKAHHMYIAISQNKMYFTYNGSGAIFAAPAEDVRPTTGPAK